MPCERSGIVRPVDPSVAIPIAVGLLLIAAVAVWFSRRTKQAGVATSAPIGIPGAPKPSAPISPGQAMLVPLPNGRGEALALGSDEALQALEMSGIAKRTRTEAPGPLPQVVRTVIGAGGGAATHQANRGIEKGKIVALADETARHLEANKATLDKAGKTLGIVKGKKGRIVHVARFDKAGAKAVTASNAATLAMTAALSQQLAAIEKQLKEIQGTLDGLVADADRHRLAETIATNKELATVARAIERRGEMTEADWNRVAALSLEVTTNATEADFKLQEILGNEEKLNRHQRLERLAKLRNEERLEYWLALQVQAELAQTRRDALYLYWEQVRHPESASQLAEEMRLEIETRQQRLFELGQALDRLSDPEARSKSDPLRQLSKRRLVKQDKVITELLKRHGPAFAGPGADSYAVIPGHAREVFVLEPGSQTGSTS
jgi:precorrin-6B methylase 2